MSFVVTKHRLTAEHGDRVSAIKRLAIIKRAVPKEEVGEVNTVPVGVTDAGIMLLELMSEVVIGFGC